MALIRISKSVSLWNARSNDPPDIDNHVVLWHCCPCGYQHQLELSLTAPCTDTALISISTYIEGHTTEIHTYVPLSQFPVVWFPSCIRSFSVGHWITQEVVLPVQLVLSGQNLPRGQLRLLCANAPWDNDLIETAHNTDTNKAAAISSKSDRSTIIRRFRCETIDWGTMSGFVGSRDLREQL